MSSNLNPWQKGRLEHVFVAVSVPQADSRTFSAPNVAALNRVNEISRTLKAMGLKVVTTHHGVIGAAERPSILIQPPSDQDQRSKLLDNGNGYLIRRIDGVRMASLLVSGVEVLWPVQEGVA